MGNNAIITVLGLTIIFMIVNSTLNRRDRDAYDNSYGYTKYVSARDIAYSSIQITLRKIDKDSVVTSGDFPVMGNLDGGTYQVDGTVVNDSTLILAAKSIFSDTTYNIKATFIRHQIPLPPTIYKCAFGIYSDSVNFGWGGSKDTIDGRDHDVIGNLLPLSSDSVAPAHVRTTVDSGSVLTGFGGN